MSGPDNIRGVDYQVSSSLLLVLLALLEEQDKLVGVRFESLDDMAEDLILYFESGRSRQIQIKKRTEGYQWSLSDLRPLLRRFTQYDETTECWFVSDGPASQSLVPLKKYFSGDVDLSNSELARLGGGELESDAVASLRGRVQLKTLYCPSADASDPAALVRAEVSRLLITGPFYVSNTIKDAARQLIWSAYEQSRRGAYLSREALTEILATAGVQYKSQAWAIYPVASDFVEHEIEADQLTDFMFHGGGVMCLVGIGGTGKTALAAEAAARAGTAGHSVCWLTLSEFLQPEDLVIEIGGYLSYLGHSAEAEKLRNARAGELPRVLAELLVALPIAIVLDRFEAAGASTAGLIRDTLDSLPSGPGRGSLLLTSRALPPWWPDFERGKEQALSSSLEGLPAHSALEMLKDMAASDDVKQALVRSVGAHPQSLALLRQLDDHADQGLDKADGVDAARAWILRSVVDELPIEEKRALAKLSVFDYPPTLKLAEAVLGPYAPDLIRALQSRGLARSLGGAYVVHDVIRQASLHLLTARAVSDCHQIIAEATQNEIASASFIHSETLSRWASHLVAATNADELGARYRQILDAEPQDLQTMFGVDAHGYPFEFDDPNLGTTNQRIRALLEADLVEEVEVNEAGDPIFQLSGFSHLDELLISAVCIYRGYADVLGYMNDMRPNYSFDRQGLFCPWQHCIEMSPLPPVPRSVSEWRSSLEQDRMRLESVEDSGLSQEAIRIIESRLSGGVPPWVTEEIDEEKRASKCFMFGHVCPGGRKQAETCTSLQAFAWAEVDG